MEVDLADVRHMAKLSRLGITEDEEKIFAGQFSQILGHMKILEMVDTTGVTPMYSTCPESAQTREDIATNRRSANEILANAPETDGQYFIVPRII